MTEIVSGASPGRKKAWKAKSTMSSQITVYPRYYPSNDSSEETPASDTLTARPLNVIDRLSLRFANKFTRKTKDQDHFASLDKIRYGKNRVPTPYPSSLADMDDGALSVSDYTTPTIENEHHSSPAMTLVMLSQHKNMGAKSTVSGRQEVKRHEMDRRRSERTIEDMISEMNVGSPPSPSRTPSLVPTLDGYPLIRSSSGSFTEGIQTSQILRLPDQLPLSRTPTIRYCEQEYEDRHRTNNHDHDHDDHDDGGETRRWDEGAT